MLRIRTILAATDFSPMSEHAFRFAGALARDYAARLIALHVVPTPVAIYAETPIFPEQPDYGPVRTALVNLRVPGVEVEYRLLEGDAAATIVEIARETHADLIVLGTHGRGGVMRVLLGSVAETVLRHAPCPVMTVKADVPVPAPAGELVCETVATS
jgi:nucleotide-binding universal stress UspA family protein